RHVSLKPPRCIALGRSYLEPQLNTVALAFLAFEFEPDSLERTHLADVDLDTVLFEFGFLRDKFHGSSAELAFERSTRETFRDVFPFHCFRDVSIHARGKLRRASVMIAREAFQHRARESNFF